MLKASFISAVGISSAAIFKEEFGSDWDQRWIHSEWKSADGTQGKFELNAGRWNSDEKEDMSLFTPADAKFYTISSAHEPFSNEGKDVIFQFQVKHQSDVGCGGGYLKFGPKIENPKEFGDPTPYNIMFGPDKCGYNKRTHLIFNYKGKNLLKKDDLPYFNDDNLSHLYRLVLRKDNTCRVEVDQKKVYDGSLLEDWDFLAPKTIADPSDTKPEDWVDDREIVDPEDKKPTDWVEEDTIADPDAKQPEDWDEEMDGKWEAPMISNPAYKGEWKARMIPNPEYKGEWKPKMIDNPEYSDDDSVYKYKEFAFVGVDVWQVNSGTLFDNIIVTDDVKEADELADKWVTLHKVEEAKKAEEDLKKKDESKKDEEEDDDDDIDEDKSDNEEL